MSDSPRIAFLASSAPNARQALEAMVSRHGQHPPEEACTPVCPAWAEGALHLFSLQRRHAEMLAACQAAESV